MTFRGLHKSWFVIVGYFISSLHLSTIYIGIAELNVNECVRDVSSIM